MEWRDQVALRIQEVSTKSTNLHMMADQMVAQIAQLEKSKAISSSDPSTPRLPDAEMQLLMQKLEEAEAEKSSLLEFARTLSERMGLIEAGGQQVPGSAISLEDHANKLEALRRDLSSEHEQRQQGKQGEIDVEMSLLNERCKKLLEEREGFQQRIQELQKTLSGHEQVIANLQQELNSSVGNPPSPDTKLVEKLQQDLYKANAAAENTVPAEVHHQICQDLQIKLTQQEGVISELQGKLANPTEDASLKLAQSEQVIQALRNELLLMGRDAQDRHVRLTQAEQAISEGKQMMEKAKITGQQAVAEKDQKLLEAEQELAAQKVLIENLQEQVSALTTRPKLSPEAEISKLQGSYEALKAENRELQTAALKSMEEHNNLVRLLEKDIEHKQKEITKMTERAAATSVLQASPLLSAAERTVSIDGSATFPSTAMTSKIVLPQETPPTGSRFTFPITSPQTVAMPMVVSQTTYTVPQTASSVYALPRSPAPSAQRRYNTPSSVAYSNPYPIPMNASSIRAPVYS